MKQELINLISGVNEQMNGGLIGQPIEAYVEKILKHATLVTYTQQGRIAGFITYYCNDPHNELAFLTLLCVAPGYTGKGIGSLLLNCSITDIKNRGFNTYQLEVKNDNLAAIKLYTSAGFETTTTRDRFLVMKKQIIHEA